MREVADDAVRLPRPYVHEVGRHTCSRPPDFERRRGYDCRVQPDLRNRSPMPSTSALGVVRSPVPFNPR